jgi:hypothetical protein
MLLDKKEVKTAEETYQVDDLTELREQEQARANEAAAAEEKRQLLAQLRTAFLDSTEDLFDELFPKEEEKKANLTMLQSYQNLKDEYKDVLDKTNQGSLMKQLRDTLLEKNAIRKKRVTSFERAIDAAELEAEEEAKKLVKSFRSRMKRAFHQVKTNPGMRTDALVEELVEQVYILREQLMSGETQVQEALEDANTKFEVQMAEIIKWMQERTGDFFRELEAHEKGFSNQLTENMQNEYEQQSGQELMDSEGRALPTKDDMLQALQNFTEMHATLLANKEDTMTNQMKDWKDEFFKKHQERQYNRNRRRIEEISQIIEQSREEIKTLEGNDMDEDAEDGADQ